MTRYFRNIFKFSITLGVILVLPYTLYAQGTPNKQVFKVFVVNKEAVPLVGASIFIGNEGQNRITDKEGSFLIDGAYGDKIWVRIDHLGFSSFEGFITIDSLDNPLHIKLQRIDKLLKEVAIHGNRQRQLNRKESVCIQLVEEAFIKENTSGSLMQSLSQLPGINAQTVGSGMSKPIIRGLGYYRVVVAQNGIKQEGQQWSDHHGLAIGEQSASHIEIIKGPMSLQYGSDAIGGVINILPNHIPINQGVTGEFSVTGKTNNQFMGPSAMVSLRRGDVYAIIDMAYQSYADFSVPKTDSFLFPSPMGNKSESSHFYPLTGTICNTAGEEKSVGLTSGVIKEWGTSYVDVHLFQNNAGFFDWMSAKNDSIMNIHVKNLRDIQLPYQQVQHITVNHFTRVYSRAGKLNIALGFQQNSTDEYAYLDDITGNRTPEKESWKNLDLHFDLKTYTANATFELKAVNGHRMLFGINNQVQVNTVDGYNHLLPEYQRRMSGIFITDKKELTSELILNTGLRFDIGSIQLQESLNPDPSIGDSVFNPAFSKAYPSATFSFGLNYLPSDKWIFKVNAGNSFRIPSAYELGANGFHRHEARFEKGSTENNPEKAWQLGLSADYFSDNFKATISPFVNYFTNYLYLNPTPEFKRGSYTGQVYEYLQNKALLTGSELSVESHIFEHYSINVGAEYVYAVNLDLLCALPQTPPLSINTSFSYQPNDFQLFKENKFGIMMNYIAAQEYTVPNELTTPNALLFDLYAHAKVSFENQQLGVYFRIRNLFNTYYYNHLSYYRRLHIPEQGRDIQLTLNYSF